ncbi:hypothetical protein ACFW9D_05460 [Streptomyces sp. NPDC059524]|uniref:hypothetical protein n=1 Tax=Streptomyces sp. NPDC059524 TaxID=3346856 RepID=UPI0036A4EF2F
MIGPLHNAGPVPPQSVDTTELGGILADLEGIHAGIDLIRDGIRLIAHDRLSVDQTQTLIATLAGSPDCDITSAIAHLVARLADADTNPALRSLSRPAQKEAQHLGEQIVFDLTDPELHQPAADLAAAIDHH